jgi:dihydrofolate reductase
MEGGGVRVSIVVAMDLHRTIGNSQKPGGLPWPRHRKDMKRFVDITKPKPVIIGRVSYDFVPPKYRPFNDRPTIVVTHDMRYDVGKGGYVADSPESALALAVALAEERGGEEVIIAGGEQIYRHFLESGEVDRIYLTQILGEFEGDAKFPGMLPDEIWWQRAVMPTRHEPDAENPFPMIFDTFDRKPR